MPVTRNFRNGIKKKWVFSIKKKMSST
jgi:hypothetical protein